MSRIRSPYSWLSALAVAVFLAALPLHADTPDPTTQTATFLGGFLDAGMPVGTIDDTTEWYDSASGTWKPAFLAGWHPWGFAPGTNTWINCGPNINTCLNQTILYRVRFALPASFTDAHMVLYINADNAGTFILNGVQVGNRHVGGGNNFLTINADATLLQPGINELTISVEDWGGAAGFNYRADFSIVADAPITPVPPGEQPDSDGDIVPDSIDAFPNDPAEWADTDGDGAGDNSDLAPNDPTIGVQPPDADGDGVPDSQDAFPNDPTESADNDHDGVGNNHDAFPNDPSETTDSDGDGVGNNHDAFPNDPSETTDSDGDGVGNNHDAFPNDPSETTDSDGDGVGNNRDPFPNSNLSASTMAGTCNSGVSNRLLASGATFNDLIAQAKAEAANHGAWVSATSALSNGWKNAGMITGQQHGKITSCVAQQNGGKK